MSLFRSFRPGTCWALPGIYYQYIKNILNIISKLYLYTILVVFCWYLWDLLELIFTYFEVPGYQAKVGSWIDPTNWILSKAGFTSTVTRQQKISCKHATTSTIKEHMSKNPQRAAVLQDTHPAVKTHTHTHIWYKYVYQSVPQTGGNSSPTEFQGTRPFVFDHAFGSPFRGNLGVIYSADSHLDTEHLCASDLEVFGSSDLRIFLHVIGPKTRWWLVTRYVPNAESFTISGLVSTPSGSSGFPTWQRFSLPVWAICFLKRSWQSRGHLWNISIFLGCSPSQLREEKDPMLIGHEVFIDAYTCFMCQGHFTPVSWSYLKHEQDQMIKYDVAMLAI